MNFLLSRRWTFLLWMLSLLSSAAMGFDEDVVYEDDATTTLLWLDEGSSPEDRAEALVAAMTLDEKISMVSECL